MLPPEAQIALQGLVRSISTEDFDAALSQCTKSRLTKADLQTVILEYGRTLTFPPVEYCTLIDAVPITDKAVPTWSVRAPLWTIEEGRSDLTLETTIALSKRGPIIEIDDLSVL
jgi:hypothetical protein